MKVLGIKYLIFVCFSCFLFSDANNEDRPLYAGTLLNFYSLNAEPGRLAFEPIFLSTKFYGNYDSNWNKKNQKNINQAELILSLETGITDFMDINLILGGIYSKFDGKSSVRYGDTFVLLGFQLSYDVKETWTPDARIIIGESFPTGKYDKLNPAKGESDASGSGSYETNLILVLQKIFYFIPAHPFNINLNLYGIYPSEVAVRDFSVYGGGFGTRGTAKPGLKYIASLGIEISLDKHWEVGTNIFYQHDNRVGFSGDSGFDPMGKKAQVGLPSLEQLSLAPSIEYNFDKNMSMAGGVWFSVAGRNSVAFTSIVFEYFHYF